jgi:hypothetical protein
MIVQLHHQLLHTYSLPLAFQWQFKSPYRAMSILRTQYMQPHHVLFHQISGTISFPKKRRLIMFTLPLMYVPLILCKPRWTIFKKLNVNNMSLDDTPLEHELKSSQLAVSSPVFWYRPPTADVPLPLITWTVPVPCTHQPPLNNNYHFNQNWIS